MTRPLDSADLSAAGRRRRATLIGAIAILLWALLALFTEWAEPIPPFQLVFLTFAIAFLLFFAKWLIGWRAGGLSPIAQLRLPAAAWALGVGGLFGYHFFYFNALAEAPAVEASLIAYLWPLLIVLFSALLPGEKLRWFHLAGALMGLGGAALLVTKGQAVGFDPRYALGYLFALACAFTWSGYSVLSRRLGEVPSDAVGGFCGATAILGLLCHLIFESWVAPDLVNLLATLALGLGPVGAAFFVWDYGVKRGDIQALGALAYSAPLISTLLLILVGRAEAGWALGLACALIVGGAALASGGIGGRSRA